MILREALATLAAVRGRLVLREGKARWEARRGAIVPPGALEALRTNKALLAEALGVLARFPGTVLLDAGEDPDGTHWALYIRDGAEYRREWFMAELYPAKHR